MSFSVYWPDDALISFTQNIEYLQRDWPSNVLSEFVNRIDEIIESVRTNPYLFPLHRPKDKIHKCVVHPRIVLYYKIVDRETIDLLVFWNTWQDPKGLKV